MMCMQGEQYSGLKSCGESHTVLWTCEVVTYFATHSVNVALNPVVLRQPRRHFFLVVNGTITMRVRW